MARNGLEEAPRAHSASNGLHRLGGSAAGIFGVKWLAQAWRKRRVQISCKWSSHGRLSAASACRVSLRAGPSTAGGRRRRGGGQAQAFADMSQAAVAENDQTQLTTSKKVLDVYFFGGR